MTIHKSEYIEKRIAKGNQEADALFNHCINKLDLQIDANKMATNVQSVQYAINKWLHSDKILNSVPNKVVQHYKDHGYNATYDVDGGKITIIVYLD